MYECINCMDMMSKKPISSCRVWLSLACSPISGPTCKPIRIGKDIKVHLGKQVSHVSHQLYEYKGLLYCNKCGTRGIVKFHLLAEKCGAPQPMGQATLRNISLDKLPPGLRAWPIGRGA